MAKSDLDVLAGLITGGMEALLADWRSQVVQLPSAVGLDVPTLNDHIPELLRELATALRLRADESIPEALVEGSPPLHGLQRLEDGFNIEEVVAEYNILRGCIHDLADRNGVTLRGKSFHITNRVLDSAIGIAVQTYATQRALDVQQRREEHLAFVAHDLRTPLHAISMAARVLEKLPPQQKAGIESGQMLKSLRRNVLHLEELVKRVLDESANLKTELGMKLVLRDCDLWPLVEALIHDLHPISGTSSTTLVNAVPEDLEVHADAQLLQRVFQNLIANAIKYTPRGEVVIAASQLADGAGVVCEVRDNGTGIPPDMLERIFEKGQTGEGEQGGLGLGLTIVRTLIEAHGGTLSVESTPGVGSTFSFVLPGK